MVVGGLIVTLLLTQYLMPVLSSLFPGPSDAWGRGGAWEEEDLAPAPRADAKPEEPDLASR